MSSPSQNQEILVSILSLNCWGLKWISKHRAPRLNAIAEKIAQSTFDIVALQEIWVHSDFENLVKKTQHLLPYSKFYFSGVLGGGLALLSKWPIETTTMWRYQLNGRPTAFWRGDWYVGKGIGIALIRHPSGKLLEIFNTHVMHAPYGQGENSYLCHRIAQAWEIAKLLRSSVQRGAIAIAVGDFNTVPDSPAHQIIQTHGMVTDSWLAVHSKSTTVPATGATSSTSLSALDRITKEGITCNSTVNTWTAKHDPKRAKRLDYVFVNQDCAVVKESTVVFTEVMPKYSCSYSDHFGINVKLQLTNRGKEDVETQVTATDVLLPQSLFDDIEGITDRYIARAVRQSRYRIYHFFASCVVVVGLLIGQWWVQSTYGQFLILLGGLVVLGTGIVDGLIGFIFGRWELHALQEFMSETQLARKLYLEGPGGL